MLICFNAFGKDYCFTNDSVKYCNCYGMFSLALK